MRRPRSPRALLGVPWVESRVLRARAVEGSGDLHKITVRHEVEAHEAVESRADVRQLNCGGMTPPPYVPKPASPPHVSFTRTS